MLLERIFLFDDRLTLVLTLVSGARENMVMMYTLHLLVKTATSVDLNCEQEITYTYGIRTLGGLSAEIANENAVFVVILRRVSSRLANDSILHCGHRIQRDVLDLLCKGVGVD